MRILRIVDRFLGWICLAVLCFALLFLQGCMLTDARADGSSPLGDAVAGAAGGAMKGGPIGAGVGGLVGLLSGLGLSLRERHKRKKVEGDASLLDNFAAQSVSGIGRFLESSLDPGDFDDLSPQEAYEQARRDLKAELKRRYNAASKALVEDKRAG